MVVKLGKSARFSMRKLLYRKQGGACCYCGVGVYVKGWENKNIAKTRLQVSYRDLERRTATLEHLKRVADGGDDSRDNLALACVVCNGSRGDKTWLDWKTEIEERSSVG